MEIKEVLIAPRSPWQTPYVERLIGSIRRECLDHVIVLNEKSLRRTLRSYFEYYHSSRCHLGLNKDTPDLRVVQPQDNGRIIEIPQVGGLHHRYERCAAWNHQLALNGISGSWRFVAGFHNDSCLCFITLLTITRILGIRNNFEIYAHNNACLFLKI